MCSSLRVMGGGRGGSLQTGLYKDGKVCVILVGEVGAAGCARIIWAFGFLR